jgi:hypothetical protein
MATLGSEHSSQWNGCCAMPGNELSGPLGLRALSPRSTRRNQVLCWDNLQEIPVFQLHGFVWNTHESGPKLTVVSLLIGQLPSPGLTINLSSNNPFRNRAASPASLDAAFASPLNSPFDDPSPRQRPVSRNPFLDQPPQPVKTPDDVSTKSEHKSLSAEDIFVRSPLCLQ